MHDLGICYFGISPRKKETRVVGILQEDRRRHVYILGKTGMGKTTLLQNMILQDIYSGLGVCFIDPHGDPSEYILNRIPPHRQQDVVYINPADSEFPVGINVLEAKRGEQSFLIASGLMAVFNKIWAGTWSSRMEYILNNTLLALLETPGNTLLGVVKMLTDEKYRQKTVKKISDPLVKNFWLQEFANFNDRYRQEAIAPILNKIGQFFSSEIIRNILGQKKSTIDFRSIMDEKKILIVNLSKGRLGEDNSNLLGGLILAKLQIAALSRVDIPEDKRNDFFVYIDEFQNFTTESFAEILSEARKFRLNLILAHQYLAQLTQSGSQNVKDAIFGNVGTIISFRLGWQDAQEVAREFEPIFNDQDLVNLNKTEIVVKLSIKDQIGKPFKGKTLPPIFDKLDGHGEEVIAMARRNYTKSRETVSAAINQWLSPNQAKIEPVVIKSSKEDFQPEIKTEPKKHDDHILEFKSPKGNSHIDHRITLHKAASSQTTTSVQIAKEIKEKLQSDKQIVFDLPE